MTADIISTVLNKYWRFMEELGSNHRQANFIPKAMIDYDRPQRFEGYAAWKAIPSTISDEAIIELETKVGNYLPVSYKSFLQYQHFLDLNLGEYQIVFFRSPLEDTINHLFEQMSQFPPSLIEMGFETPLERGYIPFANFSDYGLTCFDTNSPFGIGHEYKVIWLDHEDGYQQPQPFTTNFIAMFYDFDKHLDEWIKGHRNES